ncbi:hypothetical protein AVEN_141158-1 [Araneus ventricosus]|uniref:Uncharacterized protein n=1 Tax=Araneus ventricosus TaxID=182803 RepID=A0A4Y2KM82_ARAVE|nr:hypothetical protein AVEN_141158-1 [Araneus ventricosus]
MKLEIPRVRGRGDWVFTLHDGAVLTCGVPRPVFTGSSLRPLLNRGAPRPVLTGGARRPVFTGGSLRPVLNRGAPRPVLSGGAPKPVFTGGCL